MIQIALIALLSTLVQLILPWWSLAIVSFIICFWRGDSAAKSFLYGFVGVALPWLLYAISIHIQTNGILTERMGELLFKKATPVLPLLVTTLLGGLVGGLAGWSGQVVRRATGNQTTNPIL